MKALLSATCEQKRCEPWRFGRKCFEGKCFEGKGLEESSLEESTLGKHLEIIIYAAGYELQKEPYIKREAKKNLPLD
jgi:hypothetical protein